MVSYKTVIKLAQLLTSSPEFVFRFMEDRAATLSSAYLMHADGVIVEAELLKRREPLINIALAKFCLEKETARELLSISSGDDPINTGLRLAVLSNCTHRIAASFPIGLFNSKEQMAAWLAKASFWELQALFENSSLQDDFIYNFFTGDECWQVLDEDRRVTAVESFAKNSLIDPNYSYQRFLAGWPDHRREVVFNVALKLAETVPATSVWASALSELFSKIAEYSFIFHDQNDRNDIKLDNPLTLAGRWVPDFEEEKFRQQENDVISHGCLSNYQEVRKGLAWFSAHKNPASHTDLLASSDLALRCSAYAYGPLTPEQIAIAGEKDRVIGINQMILNKYLWRMRETREALKKSHEKEWERQCYIKDKLLYPLHSYKDKLDAMFKKNPEWFSEGF